MSVNQYRQALENIGSQMKEKCVRGIWYYTLELRVKVTGERLRTLTDAFRGPDKKGDKRLWSYVDKTDPGGCWIWIGSNVGGYGYHFSNGKRYKAHKLVYTKLKKDIGTRRLRNTCGCTLCVNPDHWEPMAKTRGVYRISKNLWGAWIWIDGKTKVLGSFPTRAKALQARRLAEMAAIHVKGKRHAKTA
jgi:hypothetical protein